MEKQAGCPTLPPHPYIISCVSKPGINCGLLQPHRIHINALPTHLCTRC